MSTTFGRDVAVMTCHRALRPAFRLASLISFGCVVMAPTSARASGFDTALFGNDDGHPALGNPYAVYFNPGAMVDAHGTVMTGAASIAIHSETYDRPASALSWSDPTLKSNPQYVSANTGQASLLNVLAAPFLGMVTDFGGSNFRLGLASYAPFGGSVQWDKNQAFASSSAAPGAYDGPQRWSSISTVTTTLAETLALAYRVEPLHLGIGVGVSVMHTSIEDTQARNADGSDDTVYPSSGALKEGRAYISVRGIQGGMNAGVWWEPTPGLRLGASYVSQPGFGTMRLKGTFQEQLGGEYGISPPAPADVLQALPDIIRLGAAWRATPRLDVRVDGTMELWSRFKNQCVVQAGAPCNVSPTGQDLTPGGPILANIPREGQDSYKLRVGAAYKVSPGTQVHASAAVESSSLPTGYEDPLLFDSTRLFGTIGLHQRVTSGLSFGLAYTFVYYLPITVTDSQLPTYVSPSRSPSADGQYSASVHIFDVAVSYRF
jgi:long-chain fatty acid transport protein